MAMPATPLSGLRSSASNHQHPQEQKRLPSVLAVTIWGLVAANVAALAALYWQQSVQSRVVPTRSSVPESSSAALANSLPANSHTRHRSLLQQEDEESHSVLQDIRLLVAIAAYDFSQLPHLEEVLDGYHDVCVAGAAVVKVVLHTTVAFPVTLLDLLQTRFPCPNFFMEIILKLPRIRLHLVDCHRQLFYDHLEEYDIFIYSEDDQRVTPRTVATYLEETAKVAKLVEGTKWKPSDFNVGIVRYEYNFPANTIIDDTTRHATENVTRVCK
jgi:hypothetical protein